MTDIKNLVFDLDGTLYPYSAEIEAVVDAKGVNLLCRCLNIGEAEAKRIVAELRRRYVYETNAVETDFGIPAREYVDEVCDVDVSILKKNAELAKLLSAFPQQKFIFTDSIDKHVRDVLAQIGVPADLFARIVDCHQTDYQFKFSPQSFEKFFALTGIRPQQSIMFEDSCRNLQTAKNLGITTVFISADGQSCPAADYTFADINTALVSVLTHTRNDKNN